MKFYKVGNPPLMALVCAKSKKDCVKICKAEDAMTANLPKITSSNCHEIYFGQMLRETSEIQDETHQSIGLSKASDLIFASVLKKRPHYFY